MLTVLLSVFRYAFLLLFFSFLYKIVAMMQKDLKEQISVELGNSDLFYAPENKEYASQSSLENEEGEKVINLIIPFTTIGRAGHNHILITDSYSSYEHARIVYQQESFYLEDLQSTNGTFLNGVKIKEAVKLQDGDQIRIGQTILVFRR